MGMDTCISITKFPCCVPESIKTLLIGYTPIQNKKSNIKKGAYSHCCSGVQLSPTLCDPVGCSSPDFPVLQYHLEHAQTHFH